MVVLVLMMLLSVEGEEEEEEEEEYVDVHHVDGAPHFGGAKKDRSRKC